MKYELVASSQQHQGFILLIIIAFSSLLPAPGTNGQTQRCENLRQMKTPPTASWTSPSECATNKYAFRTIPLAKLGNFYQQGEARRRTNSIDDFCFLTDMRNADPPPPGPPFPPGSPPPPVYAPALPAPVPCYKNPPTPSQKHSVGNNPHWAIIDHLVKHKAQSYQPYDDLPWVDPNFGNDKFFNLSRPISQFSPPMPEPKSANPYFLEVTGVSVKGELLQNFLHFRIFANMSVALGKDQLERHKTLHQPDEKPNNIKGRISAVLIMVKDQDGWPVGDFNMPIPCHQTCYKYSHDVYYGDRRNALPCSYTPPFASSHPGMFVFDADPGRYCTGHAGPGSGTQSTAQADPRDGPQTARLEGVREVHATWSFGHSTCNYVSRLFIQTLIFEDVETVYPGYMERTYSPTNPPELPTLFLFGWTAQYNIIQTTRSSLGAPDFVDLKYLEQRVERGEEVDCHVPLFDAENMVEHTFRKFHVPSHDNMQDARFAAVLEEIRVPSRSGYTASIWPFFIKDNALQFFGQHAPDYNGADLKCRELPRTIVVNDNVKSVLGDRKPQTLLQFLEDKRRNQGIRCPCPALASTLPPENRTADPARLHGRLIHASHMAIAYMFLTPIGCFVARYYKETFVMIFCFQEYWWFMWHVVTLIAACLFNIGAITSIARKKQNELVYNDNLQIHIIFGAISMFVFYMEIITGFFRVADPKKRMRQIFMHWFIGTLNNLCAVMSMFAMAWVDQSGFSCNVAYSVILWVVFVVACYCIMEWNMRKTDKKLKLLPRRSYLPPPVKRLFTREPPGREFRLAMLAIFILGLLLLQALVSYHIWNSAGTSCEEEYIAAAHAARKAQLEEDNLIPGEPGAPSYDYDH